jgi:DNA-binding NarL/FixJ family response regulator
MDLVGRPWREGSRHDHRFRGYADADGVHREPSTRRTRALLVNGSGLLRHALRSVLADVPDIDLVGEASREQDVVQGVVAEKPSVIVVDGTGSAVDLPDLMKRLGHGCGVRLPGVLILAHDLDEHILQAFRRGARGILLEHASPEQLVAAVRMVAAGYSLFLAPMCYPLATGRTAVPPTGRHHLQTLGRLTPRESDILQLVAAGCSNAQICERLRLSESTVKSHVQHMLNKLGLRNRVHAVIYAYETGFARTRRNGHRTLVPAPGEETAG